MKLSHSKLTTILKCPMTYYINYKMGIKPKFKKPALTIGEAVHWGLEHNTDDLDQYYKENNIVIKDNKPLEEAMCYGYLLNKDKIFEDLLEDIDGTKLELLDEYHELEITSPLKSNIHKDKPHDFIGIIDLLLLTNKGLIVVDYKTSSTKPDFDQYLDQLYRYIFLLKSHFDVPIIKLAIINLQKSKLKKLRIETDGHFKERLKKEYLLNDNDLINWYIYNPDTLENNLVNRYISNLSTMADVAELIDSNEEFYVNYSAINDYGGSDYKEILNENPSSYILYDIKDTIYDKDSDMLNKVRDCNKLDIDKIYNKNILNKYEDFEVLFLEYISENKLDPHDKFIKNKFNKYLSNKYEYDLELLEYYFDTFYYFLKKF